MTEKVTISDVAGVLQRAGGNLTLAAAMLKCNRSTIVRYMKHQDCRDGAEAGRQAIIDEAERVIQQAIVDGDVETAKWWIERNS